MKIVKLLALLLLIPASVGSITVDIINYSRDAALVSSNYATTDFIADPRYPTLKSRGFEPLVHPAEDKQEHAVSAQKPPVPARHTKPTTYILETKNPADFFYFSTNRGIFSIDRAQDNQGKTIWVVRQKYLNGSKEINQNKDLAVYTDEQLKNIKKILISIYQNTQVAVESKL